VSAASAAALRKLQTSGANSLTNAERALLGMAPKTSNVLNVINKANTFNPNAGSILKKPEYMKPGPPMPSAQEIAQREQAARDQAARDQAARNQAARDQAARDQAARDQAARDQAARDQAAAQAASQAAIDEANRKRAEQEERDRQAAAAAAEQARQEAIARMPRPLTSSTREPVKYATPSDVLIDTNDLPIDLILKLTLEKIGGLELISLVRHDTVNGQNIVYRPVKNIPQLAIQYNPQNIVKMPDSADSYFKNFPIKLENYIQQTTNELPPLVAYIDPVTENVIIDVVNTKRDYEIEVQMVSSGKVFDDTIYEEDN
jgi:flagellar biosynthesis GTPase FlhF